MEQRDHKVSEMIFLKDRTTAENWLSDDPDLREIFMLEEAIDFVSRFFKPMVS